MHTINTLKKSLHIELLGSFRVRYGDQPIDSLPSARMQSLMAYLLLHRESPVSRQQLAYVFWPESSEKQARTNLRQLLHHLLRAFPQLEPFVQTNARTIQWQTETPFSLDVDEFEQALLQAKQAAQAEDQTAELHALKTSLDSYQGDLLPECYQEWIEPFRDRLRQQYLTALQKVMALLERQRAYPEAVRYARRWIKEDDLQEKAYGALMRVHALNHDRAAALNVYRECRKVLRRELNIEPGREIRELYQRLLEMSDELAPQQLGSQSRSDDSIPLIGREREWEQLCDTWQTVEQNPPQMLWIMGEAGIGKSRLAEELIDWVKQQGGTTAHTRFYAAEGGLAFTPVRDWLRTGKFQAALSSLDDVWLKEVSRVLPELRNKLPNQEPLQPLMEAWQRQQFFEALVRAILMAPQPLLLVIDDLQWCDQETLEWLHYLLRFDDQAKMLLLCTVRSELVNENKALISLMLDLQRSGHLTKLELSPLNARETARLAATITTKEIADHLAQRLYQETEGNPLFVVEMSRAGLAELQATEEVPPEDALLSPLPPRIQSVIQYRLMQLSPEAQKLVELAATIGHDFNFPVLRNACEHDEERLIEVLEELLLRRIIREQGATDYDFSHDKIREVAYFAISESKRRLLHRRVAQALESLHAPNIDYISARLAIHYEKAGVIEKAIDYYERAGKASRQLYANNEAIEYLQRGLELVMGLPEHEERSRKELALSLAIAPPLVQAKGYGAKEVHNTCHRVHFLCHQLKEPTHVPILRALAIGKLVTGEILAVESLGKELLQQAQQTGDEVVLVEAHYVLGVTYHWQGNFTSARHHLEKALQPNSSHKHEAHITHYGQDPDVVCRIRLAMVLWKLGYPYQAKEEAEKALSLSEKLNHPFSRAYALHWCAWLHNLRGDVETTLEHSAISMEYSRKFQFPYFTTQSRILLGWAMFEQNRNSQGLEQMRSGLAHFRATGSSVGTTYYRGLLALNLAKLDRGEQALSVVNEALGALKAQEERWQEAELYRLKGNILSMKDKSNQHLLAEESFRKAIEIAHRQKARGFALHAACDLKRFLENRNRQEEAEQLFNEINGWFRKGRNASDLKEAETLVSHWR